MTGARRTLAVALHDIEPATFERSALIRDWLYDHGVNRVTLLVIPARDLHPLAERSPEMVSWLLERERTGDAIAQHGFQHLRSGRVRGQVGTWKGSPYQTLRVLRADRETEFVGLDAHETHRAVDAGRRVLKLAGIEPRGFVAPGYAYTPELRQTLGERFHWWAGLLGLHSASPHRAQIAAEEPLQAPERTDLRSTRRNLLAPPIALSSSGRLRSLLSPALLRAGTLLSGATLRLDLYPADLDRPSHMLALEWVLQRSASTREAVTYEELAACAAQPGPPLQPGLRPVFTPEKSDGLSGFTSERPA
jgi:predicted deacetylase